MSIAMTMEEIQKGVVEIVSRNSLHNPEKVNLHSNIKNDHGIDSLKIVNLLFDLEDEFGIIVDQNSMVFDNFATAEKFHLTFIRNLGTPNESDSYWNIDTFP